MSRPAHARTLAGGVCEEDKAVQDGKHVILCVDDDPDILESLRLIIESHGHMAVPAATAEEGLRKYRETDPDLIIADLMMEEVDAGTHLLRELKAEGNTKPVYILSSVGDMLHAQADDVALGATGVLQKPLSIEALGRILKEKLGG